MKVGVFIDVVAMLNSTMRTSDKRHLNYKYYLAQAIGADNDGVAFAYGCQFKDEAESFITCLRAYGFVPKYHKPKVIRRNGEKVVWKNNWEVGLAVDVMVQLYDLDRVVLGISDSIYLPLVEQVLCERKECVIMSVGISNTFKQTEAKCIELDASYFFDKVNSEITTQEG